MNELARKGKVERVIEERGLDGLGRKLRIYWLGELGNIAFGTVYFNHRILQSG